MARHTHWPAALLVCGLLAACGQNGSIDPADPQASVLPATENTRDFGDYVLYFNAMRTDQLSPEIAREYEIVRSPNRAMLTVSIHRKREDGTTEAVTGAVTASAANLNGQLTNMTLREIREEAAIYYIGELAIMDGEVLIYTIDASPSNEPSRFTVRFQKQFFTD